MFSSSPTDHSFSYIKVYNAFLSAENKGTIGAVEIKDFYSFVGLISCYWTLSLNDSLGLVRNAFSTKNKSLRSLGLGFGF